MRLSEVVGKIRQTLSRVIEKFASLIIDYIPTKEMVVFECESDMDDNPRAFYEYLLKRRWNRKHKIVWFVNDVNYCRTNYAKKNVIFINREKGNLRNRIRMRYYCTVPKYYIFSHPYWFMKRRKEQVVVTTGHGTPVKNISVTDDPNLERCYDWRLVPTKDVIPWIVKEGCPPEKTVICGSPRLDELFHGDRQAIMARLFGDGDFSKVIICMPTYKKSTQKVDSVAVDKYSLDVLHSEEDYEALNTFLQEQGAHLIIKPHPLQILDGLRLEESSNIHYITNRLLLEKHIIFYQLLGCCDGLITDLSSVIYDFLLLDRPIGLLTDNYDKYVRGFMVDNILDFLPGTAIRNMDELKGFINNCITGEDSNGDKRESVNKIVNKLPSGHYCNELYDMLFVNGMESGKTS